MADLLTPEELAKELRIGIRLTYSLLQSGRLPGRKVGGLWRTTRESLDEWLAEDKAS